MTDHTGGATIPIFTAIDSAGSPQRKAGVTATAERIPEMVNFLSARLGPTRSRPSGSWPTGYPTSATCSRTRRSPISRATRTAPQAGSSTLAHELAHQWMGDSISPANWSVIWFNEGWATFAEVLFDHEVEGADMTPQEFFRAVYATRSRSSGSWRPPVLDGDPAKLFNGFAVYNRPGAMLAGPPEDRRQQTASSTSPATSTTSTAAATSVAGSSSARPSGPADCTAEGCSGWRLLPPVAALGPAPAADPADF